MTRRFYIALACALIGMAGFTASPALAQPGIGVAAQTIDFSSFNPDPTTIEAFDGDYFASDGIRFSEPCGPSGCGSWQVGAVQGDAALRQFPFVGPMEATFSRPVSAVAVSLAPMTQGTAAYVLRAYAASGALLATTSETVTQDFGDPANTGFGYIGLRLEDLDAPATKITLESNFVRSSFEFVHVIDFGVSSISYQHFGGQPDD